MSIRDFSFESSSKTGASGTIIPACFSLWLFIITSDSGIRCGLPRLVFLFIRRPVFTHSLPYPDRSSRLAGEVLAADIQLPGPDVPVRHDPVVPVLCVLSCVLSPYDKLQPQRITQKMAVADPRSRGDRRAHGGYLAAPDLAGD